LLLAGRPAELEQNVVMRERQLPLTLKLGVKSLEEEPADMEHSFPCRLLERR
jgi:hypothetical protein